jgi:hypothetical protein
MNTISNVTYVQFRNARISAPARISPPVCTPRPSTRTRSAVCPAPLDTDALVQRMVLGDGGASDELMTRYGKRLRAIAMDVLGDEEESERTVYRVFEEACFGWPPERGQVERWLTRLVRRAARARRTQMGFDA